MNNFEKLMLLALASGAMVSPAAAQSLTVEDVTRDDDSIRFSTGVHISTGRYGEAERTTVVSAPLALKYSRNNLSLRISVPYIWIDGPATLLDASHGGDAVTGGVSSLNEAGDLDGRLRTFTTMGQVALWAGLAALLGEGWHLPSDSLGWLGLSLLTFLYGTAFTIMFTVLPRLGVVGNSPIMNVEPVFALLLAWALLGQAIAPLQLLGAAVVVGTVMVLGLRRR